MSSVRKALISNIPIVWIHGTQMAHKRMVIWLPGFGGTKEGVYSYLEELAAHGFVALSYDPYQHGERRIESQEELRARVGGNIRRYFWPILTRTAEDASIVIEWALAELNIADTVGMGGISMGGDISIAAAGVDHRIVAGANGIATPDWLRPGSFEPPGMPDEAAQVCYDRRNPLTHLEAYAHCPAISFQCGAEDRQVPPDGAQRFVAALQERYSCASRLDVTLHRGIAHKFTPDMWQNCLDWFTTYVH
jgi:uncharacterized protein